MDGSGVEVYICQAEAILTISWQASGHMKGMRSFQCQMGFLSAISPPNLQLVCNGFCLVMHAGAYDV